MWEVFKNCTNCDSSLQICGRYSHHLVFQNHSLLTSESLLPLLKLGARQQYQGRQRHEHTEILGMD